MLTLKLSNTALNSVCTAHKFKQNIFALLILNIRWRKWWWRKFAYFACGEQKHTHTHTAHKIKQYIKTNVRAKMLTKQNCFLSVNDINAFMCKEVNEITKYAWERGREKQKASEKGCFIESVNCKKKSELTKPGKKSSVCVWEFAYVSNGPAAHRNSVFTAEKFRMLILSLLQPK